MAVNQTFDGDVSIEKREPFSAVVNDTKGVQLLSSITETLNIECVNLQQPFAWSEDFGEFRKKCPITLFGLGAGEQFPALHSETYNFEDDLIPVGTALFCEYVKQFNYG